MGFVRSLLRHCVVGALAGVEVDALDLDVLLVVSDAGVERIDRPAEVLDARLLPRPMDPLTPVWSLDALPAGAPVAGPEVAAWWRRDGAVLTAADKDIEGYLFTQRPHALLWVVPLKFVLLGLFGQFRGVFYYFRLHDAMRMVFALSLATLAIG